MKTLTRLKTQFHLAATVVLALVAFTATAQQKTQKNMIERPWPHIIIPQQREAGDPMQLQAMDVQARIVGLQVEVTSTMTFFNPNHRQLEGELVFPLPDGAAVTGYALDINGQMIDGVIVKKEKARVTFENEARRRVDPGIVEYVAGNVYRTRIYPLPGQGTRKIRLTYVAQLATDNTGDAAWHLPLPIGETVGKLAIHVSVSQGAVTPQIGGFGNLHFKSFDNQFVAETELTDAKPGEDLWVSLPKLPAQVSAVERTSDGDTYFAISDLPGPVTVTATPALPHSLGIAWDASGSRDGKHIQREIATLKELFQKWPKLDVTLLVFRDRPEDARVFHGDTDSLIKAINELPYDGGTDFIQLSDAMKSHKDVDQWLLFTDGFDTLSGKLPDFGKSHVTAVVSQTIANRELLRQVCGASGGQLVDLQQMEPAVASAAIVNPAPTLISVDGSSIAEVQGIGASAQGRVSIFGKLTADETELRLTYSDGSKSAPIKISKAAATSGSLLSEVWAAERIKHLAVRAEENEDELLTLGRQFGIVSPVTSLIVLENLDQYVRNDIEPPASLPDMRTQWMNIKSSVAKIEQHKQADKFQHVLALWKARVDWWENTKPQELTKKEMQRHSYISGDLGSQQTGATLQNVGQLQQQNRAATPSAPVDANSSYAAAVPAPAAAPMGQTATLATDRPVATATDALEKAAAKSDGDDKDAGGAAEPAAATVTIKPWDPGTPYLIALKAASKADRYKVYLEQRKNYATSPAFFLDCAGYFLQEGDKPTGIRILTNLAELKLEEASLLRVLAWRLQQAGELDRAIVLLRKVGKLRPEEPQSLRDLALALAERGKLNHDTADLSESMALLDKMVFGEWQRFDEIQIFGLEELNALIAWVNRQSWDKSPVIPQLDSRLVKNLDVDVRIVMVWDADNTDVDIHVVEPSGEEAFYNNNRTASGGLVSRDIQDGYGPEEYMVRHAQKGGYGTFAQYYGSHQQTVVGPTTITAVVFTDFGRPTEKKQIMTLRLDKPNDRVAIGEIQFGGDNQPKLSEDKTGDSNQPLSRATFRALTVGQSADEIRKLVGEPQKKENLVWIYKLEDREFHVRLSEKQAIQSVSEALPGGAEMILTQ
ncbi:MAG: VIT domain-containing protein [Chthoniobacteraceae bacterium]